MKEKSQRWRSYMTVGIPSLILIYFLATPFFWLVIAKSVAAGREPSEVTQTVFVVTLKAPAWVADKFRPYYEYWRLVDRTFGPGTLPTWEEYQLLLKP